MLSSDSMSNGGYSNWRYFGQSLAIALVLGGVLVVLHAFMDQANSLATALRSFYLAGSLLKPGMKPEGVLITLYAPAFIAGWWREGWRPRLEWRHRITSGVLVVMVLFALHGLYPRLVSFKIWWIPDNVVDWIRAAVWNLPIGVVIFSLGIQVGGVGQRIRCQRAPR
jgi:hypothetical protein